MVQGDAMAPQFGRKTGFARAQHLARLLVSVFGQVAALRIAEGVGQIQFGVAVVGHNVRDVVMFGPQTGLHGFGGCRYRDVKRHQRGRPKGTASPLSKLVATSVSWVLSWRKSLVRPFCENKWPNST